MNWHRLNETAEGDEQCSRCHVVIDPRAAQSFILLCPQPPCPAMSNPDDGCVFVPGRAAAPACLYCGRMGGKGNPHDDDEPEFEPGDDELAELADF